MEVKSPFTESEFTLITSFSEKYSHILDDLGLAFHSGYIGWAKGARDHPRMWSTMRKSYDIGSVMLFDFFITALSTAAAPAAKQANEVFHLSQTVSILVFMSVFLLGQTLGGIVFPPFSETFGRKNLYIMSAALDALCCLIIGLVPRVPTVVVCRLISGCLSSIPSNVVPGSIEDIFHSTHRIWIMFFWATASNLGLVLGPILSEYICQRWGWRTVFYVAAGIATATMFSLFFIEESRPSIILQKKVAKLRAITGDNDLVALEADHKPTFKSFVENSLTRPVLLLFTEPIVFLVSMMAAVAFALVYLFTEAIPLIYTSFGFSPTSSNLPFLAIGIGFILGIGTRFYDQRIAAIRRKQKLPLQPEDKLMGFRIGAPVLAVGLWWFAWVIPPIVRIHWMISCIPLVLIGYALNEFDAVLSGYLADSYMSHAASAFGAEALVRNVLSAVFPLFTNQMFGKLGSNVAGTVLAIVATLFCIAPLLFIRYGKTFRQRSRFAQHEAELVVLHGVVDNECV